MNQSELLNDLKILMGAVGPGHLAFTDDHYGDAIQWAQSMACRLTGISYLEVVKPTVGATGPWGEAMTVVPIPLDAIKVTRVEIEDAPSKFSITVSPANSRIQFDEFGDQVGVLVLSVVITRQDGFTDPIDISCPAFVAPTSGTAKVYNQNFEDLSGNTVLSVPDEFTILLSDFTKDVWDGQASLWINQQLLGVSELDASITALSNPFTITDPEGEATLFIEVTPTSQQIPYANPPEAIQFIGTITRLGGYSGPISLKLPNVRCSANPNGDPTALATVSLDGVLAPSDTYGDLSHPFPSGSITIPNAPDTNVIEVLMGTNYAGSEVITAYAHLEGTDENGVTYFSNKFEVLGFE